MEETSATSKGWLHATRRNVSSDAMLSSGPSRRNLSVDSKTSTPVLNPCSFCSTPFDVDPTDVGSDLQMELIELHCDEQLKSRLRRHDSPRLLVTAGPHLPTTG